MKSALLFAATFMVGAMLALGVRAARHEPYAEPAPAETPAAPAVQNHHNHAAAPAAGARPVNTTCAVCGMEVDPDIKPAVYQGKLVGFGCAACPAKFAKNPDRYGPSALRNEIAPK